MLKDSRVCTCEVSAVSRTFKFFHVILGNLGLYASLCIFVHSGINMLEDASIILNVRGHREAGVNPRREMGYTLDRLPIFPRPNIEMNKETHTDMARACRKRSQLSSRPKPRRQRDVTEAARATGCRVRVLQPDSTLS